jgi:hypothetical protein
MRFISHSLDTSDIQDIAQVTSSMVRANEFNVTQRRIALRLSQGKQHSTSIRFTLQGLLIASRLLIPFRTLQDKLHIILKLREAMFNLDDSSISPLRRPIRTCLDGAMMICRRLLYIKSEVHSSLLYIQN